VKIWLKFLIGSLVGFILGALLPPGDPTLDTVSRIIVGAGRYALIPLLFFSLVIGAYELKEDRQLLKLIGKTFGAILATTAMLSLVGILSVLIANPPRIDKAQATGQFADAAQPGSVDAGSLLAQLFPANAFNVLSGSGDFLLPLVVLALLLGLLISQDRAVGKPLLPIFDSLSRIFYHVNSIFIEFLGIGIIALAASQASRATMAGDLSPYGNFLVLLGVDLAFVVLLLYPAILFFALGKKNPYKWLYSQLGPLIAAAMSGDLNFTLGSQMKHVKESGGVRRRAQVVSLPLFSVFGRGGTALVTALSLVFLQNTISSMGLSISQILWIAGASAGLSFLLGAYPGMGAAVAITALCAAAPQLDKAYLWLKPVEFAIIGVSAMIDTLTASISTMLIARSMEMQTEKESRFYI
jgi:Na+/H+-dicarboxylate symporter